MKGRITRHPPKRSAQKSEWGAYKGGKKKHYVKAPADAGGGAKGNSITNKSADFREEVVGKKNIEMAIRRKLLEKCGM